MSDKPAYSENNIPLGAMFKFIHLASENRFNATLQELNLTSSQMHILFYLDHSARDGKRVNQRDIDKNLHLTNPTVTGLLQRLEAKGFIIRKVSETDGRNKEIFQTEACHAIHAEMHKRLEAENELMVKDMTKEEVLQLKSMLQRVLKNMQEG